MQTPVCVLSYIKSAVGLILSFYMSGDRYLGAGATDRHGSLRDGRPIIRTELLPFRWRYLWGSLNAGSTGLGWTIFGLSETDFCHWTANISKTVSRSITCHLELITSARTKLSKKM